MASPFKYTDKTYNTILASINAKAGLVDKPLWFKTYIAGLGDTFSVIIDAVANDSFLDSALTRESAQALLRLIDYELGIPTTSNGTQIFNVKETTPDSTVFAVIDLIAVTQGSLAISSLRYEARESVTYNTSSATFTRTSEFVFTTSTDYAYTGKKVRLTSTGTLPAGLSIDTDYFIVYLTSTTFSLANSISNAFNGVLVSTTDSGTGIHTANLYAIEAILYQQETKDPVTIGQSDGATAFQEFDLPDANIIEDTLTITIDGDYTQVTTLVNSTATDKVYKILNKTDGIISIMFGNNEFGVIPPVGIDIVAEYATGGGSLSNQSNLNIINTYAGDSSEITSTTNPVAYTGGNDEEAVDVAKVRAPILLKAKDRFITQEDGEFLVLQLGGISKVKILTNYYGVLSVKVLAIANGGGNVSPTVQTTIETELISKSILQSITVVAADATLTAPTVVCNVQKTADITFSELESRIELGIKLFFTETGEEIKTNYDNEGFSDTLTLINTIFAEAFGETDTWIEPLLINLIPVDFADNIDESDIVTYIKSSLSFIDDIVFTSPTFPLILGDEEITTHTGISITINEVT